MTSRFALLLVAGTAVPLLAQLSVDRDRVVAKTDSASILYRMIACEPGVAPDECRAREQERIDRRIHRAWIDAATKMYHVTLTPREDAAISRQVADSKSVIEKGAARYHALAVAVLKIRRGEDRSHVLSELSRDGIAERDLEWELAHVRTLADAERAAAKDFVADGEKSELQRYTQMYAIAHFREIVKARAVAERITFDEAEEQFWSEVARATHTRILDPAFAMPDRKGILVSR